MDRTSIQTTSLQRALELVHGQPIDRVICDALRIAGSRAGAAKRLSIQRTTLLNWIDQFGIDAETVLLEARLAARKVA